MKRKDEVCSPEGLEAAIGCDPHLLLLFPQPFLVPHARRMRIPIYVKDQKLCTGVRSLKKYIFAMQNRFSVPASPSLSTSPDRRPDPYRCRPVLCPEPP